MGVNLGLGAFLLLPVALLVQVAQPTIGVLVYAIVFVVAGVAGVAELLVVRRLPKPGRVLVAEPRKIEATTGATTTGSPTVGAATPLPTQLPPARELDRFLRSITLAAFGAGFGPYLSIYAISVLGLPPAFAILLAALASAASLVSATIVGGLLGRGSSSRTLRLSFLMRGGSMILGLLAFPQNPLAWLVLCVVAILASAGAAAGTLSSNERLMRLAPGPDLIQAQGRFVAGTAVGHHHRPGRQRRHPGRPAARLPDLRDPVRRVRPDPLLHRRPGRGLGDLVVGHDGLPDRGPPGPRSVGPRDQRSRRYALSARRATRATMTRRVASSIS